MRVPSIVPILFCLDILAIRFSDTCAFLSTHQRHHSQHHHHHHKVQHQHHKVQHSLPLAIGSKTRRVELWAQATKKGPSSQEEEDNDDEDNDDEEEVDEVVDAVTLEVKADLKKTLYDVLGASPTDTRTELKKCYVSMAKKYHPDALVSMALSNANAKDSASPNNPNNPDESIDFSEIAAAWRVLSDPKERRRYDRTLQAEQFSQDVTALASQWGKNAAPAAKMFENMAIPFIRRTTATTLASFQAAAQDLSKKQQLTVNDDNDNNMDMDMDMAMGADGIYRSTAATTNGNINSNTTTATGISSTNTTASTPRGQQRDVDFSRAFKSAMAAAQRAGRYVDSMELTEKSQNLQARALKGVQEAALLQEELQKLATKRLQMVLHTPASGLTSADAFLVLNDFNKTVSDLDELTVWDQVMMKMTIPQEIQALQQCELTFVETQAIETQNQLEYQQIVLARLQAQTNLTTAIKKEEELRLALEKAQELVAESKTNVEVILRNFTAAEHVCRKSQHEKKRATTLMEKQSERVRAALRQKERDVLRQKGLTEDDTVADSTSEEESESRLQELLEIRREEQLLAERSARLEGVAARLMSRANKLKISAEEMHKMQ
jgi:curved DNA-binding protein CbpA